MHPYVIKVPLGVRSYTISIGSNLLSRLGHECKRLYLGQRCAVISDRNVAPHYGQTAVENLEAAGFEPTLITVPAGETAKSLKVVASCYDQLAEQRLERKSFVVALGGGDFPARHRFCANPDDTARAGGQFGWRQGRSQFESRQEPGGRILSAALRVMRPRNVGDTACARVS